MSPPADIYWMLPYDIGVSTLFSFGAKILDEDSGCTLLHC